MTTEDKRKPKKNKKKKKRETDNDHVFPAEKDEESKGIGTNSDRIQERCKMYANLPESDVSDGAELCTSTDNKDIRKKKKKECIIVKGETSGGHNQGCDEIMSESLESQTSTKETTDVSQNELSTKAKVRYSELDQDGVLKKSKKKKKKEKVGDGEGNVCIQDVKVKSAEIMEGGCGFKECVKKESDSEEAKTHDNSDIMKVKKKGKDGKNKKRKRKREEVSKQVDSHATDDGSQDNESEPGETLVKKKKKSKDKTKNKLVEDKEKMSSEDPEVSEKNDAVESQWQSAEFGNTVQKEKFLRLMGAYKPSNKQRVESTQSSYSVMAMDRQQQSVLSNSLEKQFVQALQTRKERGVGLGYQQL